MILDPELNTRTLDWSAKVSIKNAIRGRVKEELQENLDKVTKFINECVEEAYKDDVAYKLCEQYPTAFNKSKSITVYGRELGITTRNCFPDKYEDSGVPHTYYIDSYITIGLDNIKVPIPRGLYRLTTKELCEKLSPGKQEILKSVFSEFLSKSYALNKELHDFESQEDSIKTIGRLYRVNPTWYEDLIKAQYSDRIVKLSSPPKAAPAKEEEVKKQEKINRKEHNEKLLEELKTIIQL